MKKYNREEVYEYAKKWAYGRNPKYYNYDLIGGDCTNFVSQCIFAGCHQMNYNKRNGWYYLNGNQKSPSWTGVEFLYQFLLSNQGVGPFGKETTIDKLEVGDVIQLKMEEKQFSHSLVVIKNAKNIENTMIAAHSFDVFGKRLSDYQYLAYRCIHIEGYG